MLRSVYGRCAAIAAAIGGSRRGHAVRHPDALPWPVKTGARAGFQVELAEIWHTASAFVTRPWVISAFQYRPLRLRRGVRPIDSTGASVEGGLRYRGPSRSGVVLAVARIRRDIAPGLEAGHRVRRAGRLACRPPPPPTHLERRPARELRPPFVLEGELWRAANGEVDARRHAGRDRLVQPGSPYPTSA